MPELPEVETVRRQLAPRLEGRRVLEAGSHPSAKFTPARELTSSTFGPTGRRGKYLLLALTDGNEPNSTGSRSKAVEKHTQQDRELVVHLGMTGQLRFRPGGPDLADPYLRAWWQLDEDETLEFADIRRFGRLRVVPAGDYRSIATLAAAGPEPWDPLLTDKVFWERMRHSRRAIKTQLLSQRPIAGVGNIYADEALWLAEIDPRRRTIGRGRAGRLLEALREVLSQGIELGGTTLRDYRNAEGGIGGNQHQLLAYGRGGLPCLRCESVMRAEPIDARTTTWCPSCQAR